MPDRRLYVMRRRAPVEGIADMGMPQIVRRDGARQPGAGRGRLDDTMDR
jgi:hypothetical protein